MHPFTLYHHAAADTSDGQISTVVDRSAPRGGSSDAASGLSPSGATQPSADSPSGKGGSSSRDSGCYASSEHLKKLSSRQHEGASPSGTPGPSKLVFVCCCLKKKKKKRRVVCLRCLFCYVSVSSTSRLPLSLPSPSLPFLFICPLSLFWEGVYFFFFLCSPFAMQNGQIGCHGEFGSLLQGTLPDPWPRPQLLVDILSSTPSPTLTEYLAFCCCCKFEVNSNAVEPLFYGLQV